MAGVLNLGLLLVTIPFETNSLGPLAWQSHIYDEQAAAEYVWVAQATACSDHGSIERWTCGLACTNVKEVHNARLTTKAFPFQTLGVIAEYGASECLLAFRGSKTMLNYLLDDFNFAWTKPYPEFCPDCMLHKGFYESWESLKKQTLAALDDNGCREKPIRIVGHSLAAAMATIAVFELVDLGYPIKHVYTFGQPRIGNEAWVNTFESRMQSAQVPYFRIVDFMDPVPHYPPQKQTDANQNSFHHVGPEVFYNATMKGQYRVCPGGEDPECSSQFNWVSCLAHTCNHCSYLGMNPCDCAASAPECSHPEGLHLQHFMDFSMLKIFDKDFGKIV